MMGFPGWKTHHYHQTPPETRREYGPTNPGTKTMIDVIVQNAIEGRPVIAQRTDNKRFVTLNWNAENWTKGDMAEAEPTDILSEHDTHIGTLDKLNIQPI